jgi:uncharacterized membrane protein YvbJ
MYTNTILIIVAAVVGAPVLLLILRYFGKAADASSAKKLMDDLAKAASSNDGKIEKLVESTATKNAKLKADLVIKMADLAAEAEKDKAADDVEVANRIIARAAPKKRRGTK